ncbi:MAG: hypothetical protein RR721_08480 [Aeromonas sp.]|uniref:hypothetical protein n=1 Tax=Aeromonas sp. TaxID=647 RepID=UPI002FC68177
MSKPNVSVKSLFVSMMLALGTSQVQAADANFIATVTADVPSTLQLVSQNTGSNRVDYDLPWLSSLDVDVVSHPVKFIGNHASNDIQFSVASDAGLNLRHQDASGDYIPAYVDILDKDDITVGTIEKGSLSVTGKPGVDFDPNDFKIALSAYGQSMNDKVGTPAKPGKYVGTVTIIASQTL